MQTRIADEVGYLSDEHLEDLFNICLGNGAGRNGLDFPDRIDVLRWAHGLEKPPTDERGIEFTWLRSAEGDKADTQLMALELFRWLKKFRKPRNSFVLKRLLSEAKSNAERFNRITRKQQDGRADEDELAWMAWYSASRSFALDLITEGIEKRKGAEA